MRVPALDEEMGITIYATSSAGIGGVIRRAPEDFRVEEVLVDGSVAGIQKTAGKPALGASVSRQNFLLCVLVKRGWDTFVAIANVARALGIEQTRIHIAGIKDAKAVTAQHIAIENVTFADVERVCLKDVEVRPVGYFRDALSPFYLLGNRFTITVSAVKLMESTVTRRIARTMEQLEAQGGIPNYFGHQRFGSMRAITHVVGKAMVNGDLEAAAMLFLAKSSMHEHPDSRAAREELQATHDFEKALENFPRQLRFERLMLTHLVENPDDFVGAFRQLPGKLQQLFVQAYQSYLFNRFLSERLRRGFALNAAEVGDYIVKVDRSGLPITRTGNIVEASSLSEVNASIEAGKMRVALPLVGFGQPFSEGEMGRIEADIVKEEGVAPEGFRVQEMRRLSGRGELRQVASPIMDFRVHEVSPDYANPPKCRVNVSFRLLRSSYATMLLREIMKPQDPIKAGF